jgi:endonuclease/exonuclease/phosphatase family metal-dependent hydrolase
LPHRTFVGHAPSGARGVAILHRAPAIASSGARVPARMLDDKGFARVVIGGVEIVALHLDWLSKRARFAQIEQLARALGARTGPRIVLGDLNAMTLATWARGEPADETVIGLSLALGVRPPARAQRSFPSSAPRWALDWVLASPDLTIGDVRAVPTRLSDHAAIVAEVHAHRDQGQPLGCHERSTAP